VGGKSGKGVSLEFSGGKSGKNGVNFNANKSKGIDSDFNTNVGKSEKGNFVGAASKSKGANFGPGKSKSKGGARPVNPINPINPGSGWSDDAWKEPPNVEERDWNDDGWTPPAVLTDAPASWAGDSYPPKRKPVTPLIAPDPSPSPSACEERMRWHPNSDYTICTNDSSFPTNGEEYVYPSLVKRCKAVFGTVACEYNDICTTNEPTTSPLEPLATPQPSPSPTSCEERMLWHPNSYFTMSTNDSNFPDKEEYIYESIVKCCKAVFGTLACEYDDICASPQPSKAPVTQQPSSPAPTTDAPVTPLPTLPPISAVTRHHQRHLALHSSLLLHLHLEAYRL
jgi:hypothetical protein